MQCFDAGAEKSGFKDWNIVKMAKAVTRILLSSSKIYSEEVKDFT
jgi:hypothetical protein